MKTESGDSKPKKPYMKPRRRKRTTFTTDHIEALIEEYNTNPTPSSERISALSEQLGYDAPVLKNWFANRRQKLRRESKITVAEDKAADKAKGAIDSGADEAKELRDKAADKADEIGNKLKQ